MLALGISMHLTASVHRETNIQYQITYFFLVSSSFFPSIPCWIMVRVYRVIWNSIWWRINYVMYHSTCFPKKWNRNETSRQTVETHHRCALNPKLNWIHVQLQHPIASMHVKNRCHHICKRRFVHHSHFFTIFPKSTRVLRGKNAKNRKKKKCQKSTKTKNAPPCVWWINRLLYVNIWIFVIRWIIAIKWCWSDSIN